MLRKVGNNLVIHPSNSVLIMYVTRTISTRYINEVNEVYEVYDDGNMIQYKHKGQDWYS